MIFQTGELPLKLLKFKILNLLHTMQAAMEEQAAAERQRRATVTKADGEKQAAILEADGRFGSFSS